LLQDRHSECAALDRLLDAVRAGESRVLVIRGEAGVGKSALLEYLVARASGCWVARATDAQSEMELAFAGLHQICAPMLDRLRSASPSVTAPPSRPLARNFHAVDTAWTLDSRSIADRVRPTPTYG
jgi:hypothetical protein